MIFKFNRRYLKDTLERTRAVNCHWTELPDGSSELRVSDDERLGIIEDLGTLIGADGVGEDGEINAFGLRVEGLIDKLTVYDDED